MIANGKSNPAFVAADLLSQVRSAHCALPVCLSACGTAQLAKQHDAVSATSVGAALDRRATRRKAQRIYWQRRVLGLTLAIGRAIHSAVERSWCIWAYWCAPGGMLPQRSGSAVRTVSSVGSGHAMPCLLHAMPCLAQRACRAAWQAEHGPDSQVVLVTYDIAPAGLDVSAAAAAAAADFR